MLVPVIGLQAVRRERRHRHARGDEQVLAGYLDDWEEKMKRVASHGKAYELSPMFKMIALRLLTTGRAREYYEMWEAEIDKDEDGYFTRPIQAYEPIYIQAT